MSVLDMAWIQISGLLDDCTMYTIVVYKVLF